MVEKNIYSSSQSPVPERSTSDENYSNFYSSSQSSVPERSTFDENHSNFTRSSACPSPVPERTFDENHSNFTRSSSCPAPVPERTSDENRYNFTRTTSRSVLNLKHGHIEESSFSIDQERLTKLAEDYPTSFHQSGGVHGIAAALDTNLQLGIRGDEKDLHRRHQAFGPNINLLEKYSFQTEKGHFFRVLTSAAIKDTTVILLLCCAILSLALGNGVEEGFVDGVVLFTMIFIAACISKIIKFLKNRMNGKRKKKAVRVMRDGRVKRIAASEVVVGDILCLETGDQLPADGLFVSGNSLKLDDDSEHHYDHNQLPPFMFTGAKVVDGDCFMLVTSVGKSTQTGNMMKLLTGDQNKESKLQIAVEKINSRLEKIGLLFALLILMVQALQCFIWNTGCDESSEQSHRGMKDTVEEVMAEGREIIKKQVGRVRFTEIICILVFALRDGLPLGLLISFAYASKKLSSYGAATVQNLSVSGTSGFVDIICTGKTGDLSLDYKKMVDLWIGMDSFGESLEGVNTDVLDALRKGISINISNSAYDHGLLRWAHQVLGVDGQEIKGYRTTAAFDLNKNQIGYRVFLKPNEEIFVDMYCKGAPEILLFRCIDYFDMHGTLQTLDESKKDMLKNIIENIKADSLQCFAFARKRVEEDEEEVSELTDSGLTLLALLALKNPYDSMVKRSIESCAESGVKIKLIVGDDIDTARLIAINSGILKPEEDATEAIIEASVFRSRPEEVRVLMIDKIRVMANASPMDKLLVVQCLKQKGHIVAVTGTCTRDSPSLQEADVGVLLGDRSAEIAKEHSDIVILDKKFATVVDSLQFGRCLRNNFQKFFQLHLTLNIAAFANSVSAIPLGPFQIFWVNLVMDGLGALALIAPISLVVPAASASTTKSKSMWRNIIIQVVYQVGILSVIQFKGKGLLRANQTAINAIVFNSFALCQAFVLINSREIEKPNVFEGMTLHQSRWFLGAVGAIVSLQVAISEIIACINHERLGLRNWCICIGIAATSTLIGLIAKFIPLP